MRVFPFNPRRWRLTLLVAAIACAAIAGWALWGALTGKESLGFARAGVSLGLCAAMVYVLVRLRPRAGWGVEVGPLAVTISKPLKGELVLPWSKVKEVRRLGARRDTLVLVLGEDARILVPRALFPSRHAYESLVQALEERVPPRHDA